MKKYLEAANWNSSLERTFTEVALPAEGAASIYETSNYIK